jgi:hypothetical protein
MFGFCFSGFEAFEVMDGNRNNKIEMSNVVCLVRNGLVPLKAKNTMHH